jgi:membrane protease YdiL (CAAX protease family)
VTFNRGNKTWLLASTALFVAGILFFAWLPRTSGKGFSASYAALVVAAGVMAVNMRKPRQMLSELGLEAIPGKKLYLLMAGLLTGMTFAMIYRRYMGLTLIPSGLVFFAFTAAAVGFTEELLFRGYLQSQLRKLNVPLSVVLATLSHTAYKLLLFASLSPIAEVDLIFLLTWTFICGIIFGILKELAGSSYPPITGHVAFDILVYGDLALNPWWIWA